MANRSSWDAGETMSDASINDCKYHFHFQNVSRLLVRVVIGFRILLKEEQGSLLPWSPCLRHCKIWKAVFWQQFKGLICFVPVKYTTVYFISADLGVCVCLSVRGGNMVLWQFVGWNREDWNWLHVTQWMKTQDECIKNSYNILKIWYRLLQLYLQF